MLFIEIVSINLREVIVRSHYRGHYVAER